MLFLNPWLLFGLLGAAIPVVIHLVRQQAAKPIDWGAMRFLFDTLAVRRRKMEWEDWLLMATRCLLLALAGLALARPFLSPDSRVPWLFVLPAILAGIALLGGSFVILNRKWRWLMRIIGIALILIALSLGWLERLFNLKRFEATGRRDVALVIDASSSMKLMKDGSTMFERAVEEAREVVRSAPRGTAFVVIRGGPAPEALTAAPLTHRADVLGLLDEIKPVGGVFRAHEALGLATLALSEGRNANKDIVLFTDAQRHGWRLDNPGAWDGLEKAWESLPSKPKLVLRELGLPSAFDNIALEELSFSRLVVGTDREAGIRVTVANRGTSPFAPGRVELEVGGSGIGEQPVGMLAPGQSEILEFRHRFPDNGPTVVRARLDSRDALEDDNSLSRVLAVRDKLRVLIIDGNPSAGFFERASGYLALALAPKPGKGNLMEPEVVPVTRLRLEDFENRDVIVLADVARLPVSLADQLANEVAGGMGLLVVAGPRCEEDFYNAWNGVAGPVLPARLGGEAVDEEGVGTAPSTFVHESLTLFGEGGDLESGRIRRWRKLPALNEGGVRGAALTNGEPWLATRNYGSGRTLLVASPFDARAGDLPAKKSFVPLAHELVTWCAGGGIGLNIDASWQPRVLVTEARGGLWGVYRAERGQRIFQERLDAGIGFDWGDRRPSDKVPRDNFRVRWSGTLVPPESGTYRFFSESDDEMRVRVGKEILSESYFGKVTSAELELTRGEPIEVEVNYHELNGSAFAKFSWQPPGQDTRVVPASVLRPSREIPPRNYAATDPLGLPRSAELRSEAGGQELVISGAAVPGVYQVELGGEGEGWLPGWTGDSLPLAVTSNPVESQFDAFTPDDRELIGSRVTLLRPGSAKDVLSVLEGRGFGRGIWRWLAVAALVFFLLENVLSRWVSKSRRTAGEVRVEFGETPAWKGGRR